MYAATDRQELTWPNVAKAICILLVVMMHSADQISQLPWSHRDQLANYWLIANEFIRPIRMPLFFLVSGLLASGSILSPRVDTQHNRLVKPLYLYFVWGLVYQVLCPLNPGAAWFAPSSDNRFLPVLLLVMMSWYLAALAMYYLLVRITLTLPLGTTLLLCAILSVLGTIYETDLAAHEPKMLRCAIFFVAGVRMKPAILAFVETITPLRTVILGAAYVVGALVAVRARTFYLPVDILAVASAATLCALLAKRISLLIGPATWLAQRTLPIYLLHFLLLPVMVNALGYFGVSLLTSFWAGLLSPLAFVPVLVSAALAAHAYLRRTPTAVWLFDLPLLCTGLLRDDAKKSSAGVSCEPMVQKMKAAA
jgi:uncharacterized membrane protein YcfT